MPVIHPETDPRAPADRSRVLKLRVPVTVQLGKRKLSVGEVLRLAVGSIIEIDKGHEKPLDLLVNRHTIGRGETVKVGENFGLRITSITTPHERVQALQDAA